MLLAGLAGCGGRHDEPPAPGLLTIHFAPHAVAATADLTLTSAQLHLDHIMAIGDAPPPNNEPPPMGDLQLDALGAAATSASRGCCRGCTAACASASRR